MSTALVLQFWVVAFMLACTPGADWAFAISAGVRGRVFPSITGVIVGYALVIAVVAVGVGAVVATHPMVLTVLTFAGAAYLLWLGLTSLFAKAEAPTASVAGFDPRFGRQLLKGMGVSATNPKGLLLLMALLPQFTMHSSVPPAAQMLLLGSLHLIDCAVVYAAVGLLARRILRARPRASVIVTRFAGVAMTVVGALLIIERLTALR